LTFYKVLQQNGVQSIVAPYEADAQLTYLIKNKHVEAIVTEDSDLLAFGCNTVLKKKIVECISLTIINYRFSLKWINLEMRKKFV
jgi:5'-3' exonuclease